MSLVYHKNMTLSLRQQWLTFMFCLSYILQHVSVTIMQIAALTMKLKDMVFVMTVNTTQLGITASSAKCPFIEMQLCLKMI